MITAVNKQDVTTLDLTHIGLEKEGLKLDETLQQISTCLLSHHYVSDIKLNSRLAVFLTDNVSQGSPFDSETLEKIDQAAQIRFTDSNGITPEISSKLHDQFNLKNEVLAQYDVYKQPRRSPEEINKLMEYVIRNLYEASGRTQLFEIYFAQDRQFIKNLLSNDPEQANIYLLKLHEFLSAPGKKPDIYCNHIIFVLCKNEFSTFFDKQFDQDVVETLLSFFLNNEFFEKKEGLYFNMLQNFLSYKQVILELEKVENQEKLVQLIDVFCDQKVLPDMHRLYFGALYPLVKSEKILSVLAQNKEQVSNIWSRFENLFNIGMDSKEYLSALDQFSRNTLIRKVKAARILNATGKRGL